MLTPTEQATTQDPRSAKQKRSRERSAKRRKERKAEADRVAELEGLAEQGPLTEGQAAELAALKPEVARRERQNTAKDAKQYQARRAEADRVAELERLAEQGPLTEGQAAELAELQPKVARRKQQKKASRAEHRQARRAGADRVAELEELAEQGPLTEEQAAELAELQPKVARQKQQRKESDAKYRQARKAAADRIVVLEALAERGPLTEEQVAELAALRPKVAEWKQQKNAFSAKYRQARKAAADRIVVLEALAERGPLTEEQVAELAALRPKVAEWKQQKNAFSAKYRQTGKAAADRVAVLEELAGRGPLTEEQVAELAALRLKVAEWKQQKKEDNAKQYQARKAAADRVAELEELAGRGPLTEEQAAELAELQPKVARRKQQKKANRAEYRQARRADADRVAELEELAGRGPLTEEQAAELRALRQKVAGRGPQKKGRDVMDTGMSGAPVAGRDVPISGPEGASEWTGADRDDRGARSDGGVDLGASVDEVMGDSAGEGRAAASLSDLDEDRQTGLEESGELDAVVQAEWEESGVPDAVVQAEWEESGDGLDDAEKEQVEGVAGDVGPDVRVAQLRESLEQAESYLATFDALPGWDEMLRADFATLPMFDQGLRRAWEEERGRVEALWAELTGMVDDEGEPAGEQMGESGVGRAAALVLTEIATLAELAGRMDRHLRAMPPEFNPNRVRENVETAKQWVRQGQWTPAELQAVESRLGAMEAAERRLRNARRMKVREVFVQARQTIAQGRVPVTYFEGGVPGGVSSRSDVRLGFEVEFKLPGENFDARVNSLGAELEREELVDWRTGHGSKLVSKNEAEAIAADGRWALIEEAERFEVEATSPILRSDTVWPSMEKLLTAVRGHGGYGSESGGHINVSFEWQLTPVQYVRVAQIAKVSEAVLYRLGNVAGGDESKQRDVTVAGTISLPSDPYAVDDDTGADGYRSLPNPKDRNRAVRFDVVGVVDDRLEFRVWAGDAGELTGNPALWQVRSELSAAMMLAGTDSAIYRELDRLMGDPDLLGYDDQVRDEGVWLEKLAEFLELLPLSEAGQAQVVQLFAWTRPWRLSGPVEGYPALVVSLPQYSVLFPAPGASKAQVVAQAYSYQLYKDTSLVVARVTSDGSGIRLRNGQAINFGLFARLLAAHKVGRGWHNEKMWTLLAIPGAPYALLSAVLQVVKGPVLATTSDVYRTTDGRLIAGDYERQSDGRVRFRPTRDGWIEFTKNKDEPSRFTGKFDLGEALMDSRTRLFLDDPVEVYRYWPARAVPVPVGLPVDAVRVPVPVDVIVGGGLAEFVRGGVAGSTGGPVVLVSQGDPGVGVVVLPGQGSDLARDLGCVVVVLTPGPVGGTPQWTVFAADGSAGPVDGSVAGVLTGGRGGLAGLAEASAGVPGSEAEKSSADTEQMGCGNRGVGGVGGAHPHRGRPGQAAGVAGEGR